MTGYQTIVVGTDGSETSLRAVDRAASLAVDEGATLVIACAYFPEKPDPRAQDILGDDTVPASAPAGMPPEAALRFRTDRGYGTVSSALIALPAVASSERRR